MAAHSAFAAAAGGPEELVASLRSGEALPDARLHALCAFTLAVLRRRGHLDDGDLEVFLAAGFSVEQALEAVTQIADTSMANHVANVAGTPVDAAFEPRAWAPVHQ
jgi:alkylhydroperoxidase family enzyme